MNDNAPVTRRDLQGELRHLVERDDRQSLELDRVKQDFERWKEDSRNWRNDVYLKWRDSINREMALMEGKVQANASYSNRLIAIVGVALAALALGLRFIGK